MTFSTNRQKLSMDIPLAILHAARPRQWLKNLLIFVPIAAAHAFELKLWSAAIVTFAVFCLCASSAYLLNDVLDINHDKQHPRKKFRPIAAGQISIRLATVVSLFLGVLGLSVAAVTDPALFRVALIYFGLTVLYSIFLKKILLIDVAVLAALYTIRIFGGAAVTSIKLSSWLLSFSFFLFLSLALLKRHGELLRLKSERLTTVPGRGYHPGDNLPVAIFGISCGMLSALVLLLYYNSADISKLYPSPLILISVVPLYFIWMARLWLLSFRGEIEEDPLLFVSTDWTSILIVLSCIGFGALASH